MGYEAFILTEASRQQLLQLFPPRYPKVIAHHVTHRFGVQKVEPPYDLVFYGTPRCDLHVIGHAEEDGIEALVCTVDLCTRRPDGKTYHITWSLDPSKGKKPVDSNDMIARLGNRPVDPIRFCAMLQYIER